MRTAPLPSFAAIRLVALGALVLGNGLLFASEIRARRSGRRLASVLTGVRRFQAELDEQPIRFEHVEPDWIEPQGGLVSARLSGLRTGRFRVSTPLRGDARLMVEVYPPKIEGGVLDVRLDRDQARRLGERLVATAGGLQR